MIQDVTALAGGEINVAKEVSAQWSSRRGTKDTLAKLLHQEVTLTYGGSYNDRMAYILGQTTDISKKESPVTTDRCIVWGVAGNGDRSRISNQKLGQIKTGDDLVVEIKCTMLRLLQAYPNNMTLKQLAYLGTIWENRVIEKNPDEMKHNPDRYQYMIFKKSDFDYNNAFLAEFIKRTDNSLIDADTKNELENRRELLCLSEGRSDDAMFDLVLRYFQKLINRAIFPIYRRSRMSRGSLGPGASNGRTGMLDSALKQACILGKLNP